MTFDIAKAAANCTCDACRAFDAMPGGFMRDAIAHSANDFVATFPPGVPPGVPDPKPLPRRCVRCGDALPDNHAGSLCPFFCIAKVLGHRGKQ